MVPLVGPKSSAKFDTWYHWWGLNHLPNLTHGATGGP